MRHVWSLLAGLTVAPLAWLFLATGQHRSQQTVAGWYAAGAFDTAELIGPAAFLAATGVLLGLLGTLRWSPFGPVAAGLLLVTPTAFLFRNPFQTLDTFSVDQTRRLLGQDLQPWLPVQNGTLLVLGALLLMAVFSTQRWRRWPAPAGAPTPAGVTSPASPANSASRPSAGSTAAAAPAAITPAATPPAATTPAGASGGAATVPRPAGPADGPSPTDAELPTQHAFTISEDEILAAARAMDEQDGKTTGGGATGGGAAGGGTAPAGGAKPAP